MVCFGSVANLIVSVLALRFLISFVNLLVFAFVINCLCLFGFDCAVFDLWLSLANYL